MPWRCFCLRRRPAVSTRTNVCSPRRSTVSIASRVVPGCSETITRSSPSRALRRLDLPTFGRPRIATRIASSPGLGRSAPGQARDDRVEQVARAVAVDGRDRDRVAEAEPVELERLRLAPRLVDLVRDQEDRLARVAEDRRQLLVAGRDPGPGVDDEEDEVGLGDRRRACSATCWVSGERSAMSTPPVSTSRNRCPAHSQTTSLRSRVTPGVSWTTACRDAGQPVDERRLADVREADDRDGAEELVGAHGGVATAGRLSASCSSASQRQRRWISSWISAEASR